ncbi:PREDICTED: putative F-box/LRR-repeat protein At4g15060 [Erythranthe guttata]|uniref:putative F-box/LRR-repeat protein At4g15060 n=1 Tax=Erythranthe guttata TaxID=4155 RepID=UPI00064D871F|nr:PREDICTED: putative F-box/LRR-repeat protein At4g15060 [Erythranthe guttata]|eukprot:XP_012856108.1 PREDICTED: putative F-box/LRR-repeat protein At4g15060 [Erythranthe guttata]
MENAADERVEDGGRTDRISNLPEEILHNILYFMSKNDTARTCVLSKRWGFLWANRLNLSYDETSPSLFTSDVTKALQHHLDIRNNHRIEEFHLVVSHPKSVPFIEKWIETLASLCAKELFLAINPSAPTSKPFSYVVHLGSAFFFKAITSLHLFRCKLSQNTTLDEKILFDRLQKLRLRDVYFTDGHIFENIITSCPLLVSMWFHGSKNVEGCVTSSSFTNISSTSLLSTSTLTKSTDARSKSTTYRRLKRSTSAAVRFGSAMIGTLHDNLDDVSSWFHRLSTLLHELRRSKIFLSVAQNPTTILDIGQDVIDVPKEERVSKELTEFLCNFLTKRDGEFRMQDDLEKFRIESFDTSGQKWQPAMSECELPESNRVRFRLKWSEANCESSPMQLDVTE